MFLFQAPPAPPVAAMAAPLPPGLQARLDALEKAKDYPGVADLIEGLTPRQRGHLLETWMGALAKSGRPGRLLEVCDAAIPQMDAPTGPRLSTARIFRAQALGALNRPGEAWGVHLENAILGYAPGYSNACIEARRAEDWKALVKCADAWTSAVPTAAEAMAWKGEALAKQSLWAEAEPLLRSAAQQLPTRTTIWLDLSACCFHREAFQEAWEAADRALKLDANLPEGLFNRGQAACALHRYREGRSDFAAALALKSTGPEFAQLLRSCIAAADRSLARSSGATSRKH